MSRLYSRGLTLNFYVSLRLDHISLGLSDPVSSIRLVGCLDGLNNSRGLKASSSLQLGLVLVGRISWLRSNLSQPQTTVWIENTRGDTLYHKPPEKPVIPWHQELWYNLGAYCDTLSVFHNVDPNPTYTILLQGLTEPWDLQAAGHGHQYVLQHGERFPAVSP